MCGFSCRSPLSSFQKGSVSTKTLVSIDYIMWRFCISNLFKAGDIPNCKKIDLYIQSF